LLAHGVAQRRAEFGVRLALGATTSQLTRLVVREGLTLAALGLVLGVVVATLGVRLLQTMLFGVTLWDVAAWASAIAVLVLVAFIASWIPARRAAGVAPGVALRD